MILEVAILHVIAGRETEFENAFAKAGEYISASKGYLRHSLGKCIEQKNKYILLAEWETLDNHVSDFRQSEAYQHWKQLLHHYYDPFPVVEHYKMILEMKK